MFSWRNKKNIGTFPVKQFSIEKKTKTKSALSGAMLVLLSLDHEVPVSNPTRGRIKPALPQSGKEVWKMKFFPGQGKVREV